MPQRRVQISTDAFMPPHHSTCVSNDPTYEQIQAAIKGLSEGHYKTLTQAANENM